MNVQESVESLAPFYGPDTLDGEYCNGSVQKGGFHRCSSLVVPDDALVSTSRRRCEAVQVCFDRAINIFIRCYKALRKCVCKYPRSIAVVVLCPVVSSILYLTGSSVADSFLYGGLLTFILFFFFILVSECASFFPYCARDRGSEIQNALI